MQQSTFRHLSLIGLLLIAFSLSFTSTIFAHPLGNFTINHYTRLQISSDKILVRYVVDMAEIPTFQELQRLDTDNDGKPSEEALKAYAEQAAIHYAQGLRLTLDSVLLKLQSVATKISTPAGAGGLPTLRLECDFSTEIKASPSPQRLSYEDTNDPERIGWREIVIAPRQNLAAFDSTAYGNGITDELKAYPENMLAAPLNERQATLSFTAGAMPLEAKALLTREGRSITQTRDRFAELITVRELTLPAALLGLLIAAVLGGVHAMSPGHGKTIVGAYLVGSRGTTKHAAFLGLTVTITHTLGVFALGLVTLFASKYILPEKLFPIISILSGLIVLILGLTLFYKRLRVVLAQRSNAHHHHHEHSDDHQHHHDHDHDHHHEQVGDHGHHHHAHSHAHNHDHSHDHNDKLHTPHSAPRTADALSTLTHTHDGHTHSHALPDDTHLTWRSLLALGISGGLLPCPSALVVMLSAISLHRVGYGLLLVITFSLGLAATLTAVGLLFLYAGRLLKRPNSIRESRLVRLLPVLSALVITLAGAAICYQAIVTNGLKL